MKFKYLIIAFGIIIVIAVLITAFLPLMLASVESGFSAGSFHFIVMPLLAFMILLLAGMSIYFFLNYRLLSLLEREDWPALAYYLEQKIFVKNRYSDRFVRLLASSYLVISDFQSVIKLESKAMLKKPSVVSKNILIFGSARILNNNHGEAAAFFKSHSPKCKGKDRQWVQWFHGFSYLLAGAFNAVEPEFSSLSVSSNDALITGLSAYFLQGSIKKYSLSPQNCQDTAETGRQRVVKAIKDIDTWNKEADKMGTDIHIAIIRKYIDEAGKWLFNILPPVAEVQVEEPKERRRTERRTAERRKETRSTSDRRTGDRRSKRDLY